MSVKIVEIGAPPPVPPRRRKRKSDVAPPPPPPPPRPTTTPRNTKKAAFSPAIVVGTRPDRKPCSLPPPPPVPPSAPRERKPQATNNAERHLTLTDSSTSTGVEIKSCYARLNSEPPTKIIGESSCRSYDVTEKIINDEPPKIRVENEAKNRPVDKNVDYRNENRSGRSSPMPGTNPRMLFTFQDFESVMNNCGVSDRSLNDQYETIATTSDQSEPTSISSFAENSLVDDDEDAERQTCFRVTTTDVPFEKCVGSLTFSIDEPDFGEHFNEPDHYIFEDYMDRSKRLNARPAFLFDDDTFDHFGRNDGTSSTRRTATKVRFVIESPSSSTPDLDNTGDSLGNIESIVDDDRHRSSVVITEITEIPVTNNQAIEGEEHVQCPKSDQFGDVPFSSILDSGIVCNLDKRKINGDSFSSSATMQTFVIGNNNEASANQETPLVEWTESMEGRNRENERVTRSTPSPRFIKPRKYSVDTVGNIAEDLMPELPVTYDPRDEGFVRKSWDANVEDFSDPSSDENVENQSSLGTSSRTSSEGSRAARKAFVNGKLNADSNENDDPNPSINEGSKSPNGVQKSRTEKKKIFIDSALRDFIDNDDDEKDFQWNESSDDENSQENLRKIARDNDEESSKSTESLKKNDHRPSKVVVDKYPMSLTIDTDNNEEKLANKPSERRDPISTTSPSTRPSKDDVSWLPVSARRNSFLENMLTESKTISSADRIFPCSIIAAHPKPTAPRASSSSPVSSIRQGERRSEVSEVSENVDKPVVTGTIETVPSGSRESSRNQLGDVTGVKIFGTEPGDNRERATEKTKRSSGEAKSDVLTELLCNFGAIKLKSVEPRKREIDRSVAVVVVVADDKPVIEREIENRRRKEDEEEGRDKARREVWAGLGTRSEEQTKVEEAVVKADSGSTRVSMTSMTSMTTKTTTTTTTTKGEKFEESLLKGSATNGGTDDRNRLREIDEQSGTLIFEYGAMNCRRESKGPARDRQDDDSIIFNESINDVSRISNKRVEEKIETTEDDGEMVSVDNCAIARKSNSQTRRNNNDNNAMTPVDVSNDQKSCDADDATTSVASVSVRSFVELYENQRDQTSKNSKSNYSVPPARITMTGSCSGGLSGRAGNADFPGGLLGDSLGDKNARISTSASGERKGDETKIPRQSRGRGCDASHRIVAGNFVAESVKTRDGILSTNDDAIYDRSVNRQREISRSGPVAAKRRSPVETRVNVTTGERSGRSGESKKYVTFYNDCEATRSDCDEGARTKTKRRAPERPGVTREERDCATKSIDERDDCPKKTPATGIVSTGNSTNPTATPRSDANLFRTQTQPEVEVNESDTINPGTATSVPKPDVSHPRKPYVFLCRV